MKQVFLDYSSWIWSFAEDDIGAKVARFLSMPGSLKALASSS